ncbi:hypothetical protein [Okeania sp. SIO2B3]|uniref:hypothetical protein n=1 Tax=Okeania sp. SIO2B3 TaxID=2607784 RepID=UPI0013BF990D|nr:hypothetical protein [Okeania sp. SIO2B3]NET45649.1 hypothetical protein [Okeania sp. SIO2B3]
MDPITWTIIGLGLLGGGAAVYFWDDIQTWANGAIKKIWDRINPAIEVVSNVILFLNKRGALFEKLIEVNIVNINTKKTRLESVREEIRELDLPDDIKALVDQQIKYKLAEAAL